MGERGGGVERRREGKGCVREEDCIPFPSFF